MHKTLNPLLSRDIEQERLFLSTLTDIHYALLQRDWCSMKHGDLDMVVDQSDWPKFAEATAKFASSQNMPIVKVYEIERYVICIILLSEKACLHLDVCLTPARVDMFGINLHDSISKRELFNDVYVISESNEATYKRMKRLYKKSRFSKFMKRIENIPVYIRRIKNTVLLIPGAVVYVPFVTNPDILRSDIVVSAMQKYLLERIAIKFH